MNDSRTVNIGFGNIVLANRIIAIIGNDSAPIKRMIQESRDKGTLVDATQGRRTRCVVIADSGHVILSALLPETVGNRISQKESFVSDAASEED